MRRSREGVISSASARLRILTRVPAKGRVSKHDHRLQISIPLGEESKLVLSDGKFAALIENPDKGISFVATVKVSGNRMYIYIPKKLWPLYERGETVRVLVTPLEALS